MEGLSFRQFLELQNETMTSSSDVAMFQRPTIGMVTREYPSEDPFFQYGQEDPFFKKMRKGDIKFKLVK